MDKGLSLLLLFFLALTIIVLQIPVSEANFIPTHAELFIDSPIVSIIKLYQNESVPIEVTVKVPPNAPSHYPQIEHIYYSLDQKPAVEMTNITYTEAQPWFHGICINYHASDVLAELTDGNHILQVYSIDDAGNSLSKNIEFAYINEYKTAQLSILSPLNKTYSLTSNLSLTFNTNTPFVIGSYILDDLTSKPFTIRDNSTLTGLTEGTHQVVLTVWTTVGKINETASFQISNEANASDVNQKSSLDYSSNSVLLYTLALAIIALVSLALVYYKMHGDRKN
jgi:hypothetical protein